MPHPIFDHPNVRGVLFHPRPDYGYTPPGVSDVTIPVEPEVKIGGRLYPADRQAPAILFFHGNGEIAADYDDLAPFYNRLGLTLLVMDYRGYGASGGQPSVDNLLADAVTIVAAIGDIWAAHQLAPARLYVMGRSLGSAAAIEIARSVGERLVGLIVESGFADTFALLARLGVAVSGAEEARDGVANAVKMSQITVPTLIIHGEEDFLIPAADGEELYRCCAAADKRLVLIPGAGHNDLMMVGMRLYFEAIAKFVM
jgi:hypothetical protein